ncbi:23577_t:CDS:1, partial [Racocetra persica]
QNPGFANLQPFSNINTSMPSIGNIRNSLHPVSRAAYIQYQLMPGIESYSYLTPGVYTQYQLTSSTESYSYLMPGVYTQYQEQLIPSYLGRLYPVSGTVEVFQNSFINQTFSNPFFLPLAHEEPMLNIDPSAINDSLTINDPSTINVPSTINLTS